MQDVADDLYNLYVTTFLIQSRKSSILVSAPIPLHILFKMYITHIFSQLIKTKNRSCCLFACLFLCSCAVCTENRKVFLFSGATFTAVSDFHSFCSSCTTNLNRGPCYHTVTHLQYQLLYTVCVLTHIFSYNIV